MQLLISRPCSKLFQILCRLVVQAIPPTALYILFDKEDPDKAMRKALEIVEEHRLSAHMSESPQASGWALTCRGQKMLQVYFDIKKH